MKLPGNIKTIFRKSGPPGFLVIFFPLLLVSIATYRLSANAKGTVSVRIDQTEFAVGESVNGSINIVLRQPVSHAKLRAGIQVTEVRDGRRRRRRRGHPDSYQHSIPIVCPANLPAGTTSFPFRIAIPDREQLAKHDVFPQSASKLPIGSVTQGYHVRWEVTAWLSIDGVDLHGNHPIHVRFDDAP
ncbi:MAG: hypothetical protein R3C59_30860 [Planctomycetaceae bacterium]